MVDIEKKKLKTSNKYKQIACIVEPFLEVRQNGVTGAIHIAPLRNSF